MGSTTETSRSCGTCTLCCKILRIDAFRKPQGIWCAKCRPGKGCSIYAGRPEECRSFLCGFLQLEELGEEWRPSHSKIVLVSELGGMRLAAHLDPGNPTAWKSEPFYSQLKRWSHAAASSMGQIVVQIVSRAIVILPFEDVDLGPVGDDERVVTVERKTPTGTRLEALKLHKDDPRLAGSEAGQVAKLDGF